MPRQKVVELPMFHVGEFTAMDGQRTKLTDDLLRTMERNGNFLVRTGILRAPVKYDHPAFGTPDKENHGKLIGYEYRNGTLFVKGTDWSERLAKDWAREARIAWSGEMKNVEYPDPTSGTMVKLGPAPVGLAMLGAARPAILGLVPREKIEFGEGVTAEQAFMTREELRASGVVADTFDGHYFFTEVTNDATRFFSEAEQENTMDKTEFQKYFDEAAAPLKAENAALRQQVTSLGEEAKTEGEVTSFCETVSKEKPLGKLALARLREAMLKPSRESIRSFVESLPPFIVDSSKAGKTKGAGDPDDNDGGEDDEPQQIAILRPKHFADMANPANEQKIAAGITAFGEWKPDAYKGIEQNPMAQAEKVRSYVVRRETASN